MAASFLAGPTNTAKLRRTRRTRRMRRHCDRRSGDAGPGRYRADTAPSTTARVTPHVERPAVARRRVLPPARHAGAGRYRPDTAAWMPAPLRRRGPRARARQHPPARHPSAAREKNVTTKGRGGGGGGGGGGVFFGKGGYALSRRRAAAPLSGNDTCRMDHAIRRRIPPAASRLRALMPACPVGSRPGPSPSTTRAPGGSVTRPGRRQA